ncbi:hypothetical protein IWX49DRAFT_591311 [Phyllosticta citricarpa]|uniref:Xylanolytic transcriptional activator regulatory domain-containing protein n=1 Tax=Phyllosticta citricarpa TaxID=55181 RepID=A0ABR1MG42_9PEZI
MTRSLNDDLAKGGILRPSLWTPSRPVSPSRARRDTTVEDAASPATLDGQSAIVQQPHQTPDSGYGAAQSSSMPQHADLEAIEEHYHVPPVSEEVMREISAWIEQQNSSQRQHIEADAGLINRFVQLYFEYFHPVMPMLHKPSFNHTRMPWMLVLAVAAVGGEYAGLETCKAYVRKLWEYLRQAIGIFVEQYTAQTLQVWFAQVVLLSHIIMAYSGSKALVLTQQSQKNLVNHVGQRWWRSEQSRRVIWSIWVLDVENGLHQGLPTLLPLNDQLDLELPCLDHVWDTRLNKLDEQTGAGLGRKVTLREALQAMHDSGKVADLDEFARRVVLLAVYQESRDLVQAAASLQRRGFLEFDGEMAAGSGSGGIDALYEG